MRREAALIEIFPEHCYVDFFKSVGPRHFGYYHRSSDYQAETKEWSSTVPFGQLRDVDSVSFPVEHIMELVDKALESKTA